MINIDDDNLFYIDYFNFSERDRTGGFFYHNDYLHLLKRMVAENEDNEDDRIREKYLWMNKKIMASNLIRRRKFGTISITLN